MAISDTTPQSLVPLSSLELTSKLTWIVTGSEVKKSGVTIKENYCPSLERVEVSNNASVFVAHQTSLIANIQTYLKQMLKGRVKTASLGQLFALFRSV